MRNFNAKRWNPVGGYRPGGLSSSSGRGPSSCAVPGCLGKPKEGKDYCVEHVERSLYAQAISSQLKEREEEELRVAEGGSFHSDSLVVKELLLHLQLHGPLTIARLSRVLSLDAKVVEAYVRQLIKMNKVRIVSSSGPKRRSPLVELIEQSKRFNPRHNVANNDDMLRAIVQVSLDWQSLADAMARRGKISPSAGELKNTLSNRQIKKQLNMFLDAMQAQALLDRKSIYDPYVRPVRGGLRSYRRNVIDAKFVFIDEVFDDGSARFLVEEDEQTERVIYGDITKLNELVGDEVDMQDFQEGSLFRVGNGQPDLVETERRRKRISELLDRSQVVDGMFEEPPKRRKRSRSKRSRSRRSKHSQSKRSKR